MFLKFHQSFMKIILKLRQQKSLFFKIIFESNHYFWLIVGNQPPGKALHSELELILSSRFSSRNEFFAISKDRVKRHFLMFFGKFGKKLFRKPQKNVGNFCEKGKPKLLKFNLKKY